MSKHNGKLRAVGYCRTSGEGQRDNTSIPIQKKSIQDFCERNDDWKFIRHYVDESKSGAKIAGREDFKRMMKDAALEQFDIIVPFDVSRFARDGADIIESAKFLRATYGIHVVDTKNGFDSRPGSNVLMNFVHAGVSEYERLRIMERMIGGRIENARNGLPWSGKKPFGRDFIWNHSEVSKRTGGDWVVNRRGKRMAELLERYANGEGLSKLVRDFPEFTNPRIVLTFIRDGQLAGTYVKTFDIPEINIHVEVPVPAIPEVIPPRLLERVLARMEHRKRWHKDRRSYPLTGFVRCGHCGKPLTGNTTTVRTYYRHCTYTPQECVFHSIRAEELAEPVLDYLFSFFFDDRTFTQAVERALPSEDDRKSVERERDEVKAQLVRIEKEIRNITQSIKDGEPPKALIQELTRLEAVQETNAAKLSEVETTLQSIPSRELRQRQAMAIQWQLFEQVRRRDWRKLSNDEIRQFLIFLFGENPNKSGHGITVFREQGRWRIAFKGEVEFFHELHNGRPDLLGDDEPPLQLIVLPRGEVAARNKLDELRGVATGRT